MECLENRRENEKTAARDANAPRLGRPVLHQTGRRGKKTKKKTMLQRREQTAGTSSGAAPGRALVA